jgi:hypothetical protein
MPGHAGCVRGISRLRPGHQGLSMARPASAGLASGWHRAGRDVRLGQLATAYRLAQKLQLNAGLALLTGPRVRSGRSTRYSACVTLPTISVKSERQPGMPPTRSPARVGGIPGPLTPRWLRLTPPGAIPVPCGPRNGAGEELVRRSDLRAVGSSVVRVRRRTPGWWLRVARLPLGRPSGCGD